MRLDQQLLYVYVGTSCQNHHFRRPKNQSVILFSRQTSHLVKSQKQAEIVIKCLTRHWKSLSCPSRKVCRRAFIGCLPLNINMASPYRFQDCKIRHVLYNWWRHFVFWKWVVKKYLSAYTCFDLSEGHWNSPESEQQQITMLVSGITSFMLLFVLLLQTDAKVRNFTKYPCCFPSLFILCFCLNYSTFFWKLFKILILSSYYFHHYFVFNALILLFKPHFAKEQFENFTTKDLGKLLT